MLSSWHLDEARPHDAPAPGPPKGAPLGAMLVTQAAFEALTLVTADRHFLATSL